jgi:hypothetical protein
MVALYSGWLVCEQTLAGHVSNELDLLWLRKSLNLRGREWSRVREIYLTWLMKMLLLDQLLLEDNPLWLIYKIYLARILTNIIQN